MLSKDMPPLDFLNECFRVDVETGLLFWKVRPMSHFSGWRPHKSWNAAWAGKRAGRDINSGYRQVFLKTYGGGFAEHRITWAIANQQIPAPDQIIDHINGKKQDNRPSNLRVGTATNNSVNRLFLDPKNKSGFRGVCKRSEKNKWAAYVSVNGKQKHLGSFATPEEAAQVAQAERDIHYGEFKGLQTPSNQKGN